MPSYATYAAAKAGIAQFEESLRRELDGEGIQVLTVYPTATDTPMMATSQIRPAGGRDSPRPSPARRSRRWPRVGWKSYAAALTGLPWWR